MAPCPAGTAACMASPRSLTSLTPSAKGITPAQTMALYSPRLWPAMAPGRGPSSSCQMRQIATLAVSSAGWVQAVALSASAGPSWTTCQRS